jgi:hypothetical protein
MKIIAMLIWIGSGHGGPTTVQGFNSLQSCNDQKEIVIKKVENELKSFGALGYCIELNR